MNADRDHLDPALDAWLREDANEAPSEQVDAAILAAAHRAVESGPQRHHRALARQSWHWWMPLAAAAMVGVVVIGVLPLAPTSFDDASSAVSDSPPAASDRGRIGTELAKTDASAAQERASPSAAAPRSVPEVAAPPERASTSAAAPTPGVAAPPERAPTSATAPRSMPEAAAPPSRPTTAPPAAKRADTPPAASRMPGTVPPVAERRDPLPFPQRDAQRPANEAPGAPPRQESADTAATSIGGAARARSAPPLPAAPAPRAAAPAPDDARLSGAPARRSAGDTGPDFARDLGRGGVTAQKELESGLLDVAEWIERIRTLRAKGQLAEAVAELRRFRAAFTDADTRLPADLRAWADSLR